jgi:hypothetical protein
VRNDEQSGRPKNVLPDLIIPAMALAFSIYYLTTITEVPWIAQASAVLVSILLMLSILAFAIRTIFRIRTGTEELRIESRIYDLPLQVRRAGLLLLAVGYVFFIDSLGFTLSTLVFLFLAIILLSSAANWKKAAMVSMICSVLGYLVFILIFETRFPKGPIEYFLERTINAG